MEKSRLRMACLIAGALAAGWSTRAAGEERLVMPYACEAEGNRVLLFRAPERSYRIYGARESQLFRYCPPDTPGRCRHWMLHRFEVDCGGVRVPWVKVSQASAAYGAAWVEGGRMSLELEAARPVPSERSFPRRRWWREARRRGFAGYDDAAAFERPPEIPREIVEFPQGFAPVLATRARFIGTPVAEDERGPLDGAPAGKAADADTVAPPASREPARAAPLSEPPGGKTDKAAAAERPVATGKPAEAEKPTAEKVPAPAKGEKAAAPADPVIAAGSVTATIINRPQGPSPAGAEKSEPVSGSSKASGRETAAGGMRLAARAEQETAPPAAPGEISTGGLDNARAPSAHALAGLPRTAAAIGLGVLALLLASSYWLRSRRQEQERLAALARRDLANVSFRGEVARARALRPVAEGRAAGAAHQEARAPRGGDGVAATDPSAMLAAGEVAMPATAAEALEVLGASPNATMDVVKKIVDGLRQSWHPDLAGSEEDRRYREQRLKQINVAWDIVSRGHAGA
jgi:hypothetical protein